MVILTEYRPALGYPIRTAAFQGHAKVLSLLLGTIENPLHRESARVDGLLHASRGNQIGTLELCLKPTYEGYNDALIKALRETSSVVVFDRIFPLCKDMLINDGRCHWEPRSKTENLQLQSIFLSRQFHVAAGQGNLYMMKYLVQLSLRLGARLNCVFHEDIDLYLRNCVSIAAASGHSEVMLYLLENGAAIGQRTLEAASMHGSAECVRMILDYRTLNGVNVNMRESLIRAVEGEHEAVLRLLLRSLTPLAKDLRGKALDVARKEGLISIARIIEGHN